MNAFVSQSSKLLDSSCHEMTLACAVGDSRCHFTKAIIACSLGQPKSFFGKLGQTQQGNLKQKVIALSF